MQRIGTKTTLMLMCAGWMFSCQAENIGSELGKKSDNDSSGYFQLGFGGGWADRPIEDDFNDFGGLVIEGRYEWHGAFVELTSDSVGVPGFAIGYELWENQTWAVDLVAIPISGGLNPADFERLEDSGLSERDGTTLSGIRATRFFGDFILQGHALALGHGTVASIAAGHFWQVKNWNLSAVAALRYNSDKVNDRLWSVQAFEASAEFPEYQAGADITPIIQLRAEYPISEHWVFETFAGFARIGDATADSPIIAKQDVKSFGFEISYVF